MDASYNHFVELIDEMCGTGTSGRIQEGHHPQLIT